jgi:hypothetical protein
MIGVMSEGTTAARRRWRHFQIVGWAVLALVFTPVSALAAEAVEGFSVTPMLHEVSVTPGSRVSRVIEIKSAMAGTTRFTVGTEDVAGSDDPEEGLVLLGEQVDSPISGADWLTPNESTFLLKKGQKRQLTVVIQAPANATGGRYAAVTIAIDAQPIGSSGVTTQSRAASVFLMNAGNTAPPPLRVSEIVETVDGDVIVDFIDDGATDVKPTAKVIYIDPVTGRVQRVTTEDAECTRALPGGAGRCVIDSDTIEKRGNGLLSRGTVTLTNDGRTVKMDMPTTWAGNWTSLLLPLAGVGLLGAFFWRRRRGRDDDPGDVISDY